MESAPEGPGAAGARDGAGARRTPAPPGGPPPAARPFLQRLGSYGKAAGAVAARGLRVLPRLPSLPRPVEPGPGAPPTPRTPARPGDADEDGAGPSGRELRQRQQEQLRAETSPVRRARARARWRIYARIAGIQKRQELLEQARLQKRITRALMYVAQAVGVSAVLADSILLPARIVFRREAYRAWDAMLEVIFVGEVLSRIFEVQLLDESHLRDGRRSLIQIRRRVREAPANRVSVAVDFVASFPLTSLSMALSWCRLGATLNSFRDEYQILQISRLRSMYFIVGLGTETITNTAIWVLGQSYNPSVLRLFKLLCSTMYMAHLIALAYIFLIKFEGYPNTPWGIQMPCPDDPGSECSFFKVHEANLANTYTRAFFWALSAITGDNGYDPDNKTEVAFSTGVMFISQAMNMVILGNIANLIASWDEARNEFRGKIEAVEEFALRYEIDPTLVTRIKRYYDLTWEKFQGADDINTILADLPSQLKMEVSESLFSRVIRKVGIFQHAEKNFILALSTHLNNVVIPAGEYVFLKGEIGTEMFFVSDGIVEVLIDGKSVADLGRGAYFGEIALLTAERRTATIRSKTDCELLSLSKSDLDELIKFYPKTRELFFQIQKKRREAQGIDDAEDALLSELPLIKKCPLFQNRSPDVARAIAFALSRVECVKDEAVCVKGDIGHEMYFVAEGKFKVLIHLPGGGRKVVAILKEGSYFGEVALTSEDCRRTADVIAVTDSALMKLSRAAFKSVCSRFPDFEDDITGRTRTIKRSDSDNSRSRGAGPDGTSDDGEAAGKGAPAPARRVVTTAGAARWGQVGVAMKSFMGVKSQKRGYDRLKTSEVSFGPSPPAASQRKGGR